MDYGTFRNILTIYVPPMALTNLFPLVSLEGSMVYLNGIEYAGPETGAIPPWNSSVAAAIGSMRGETSFLNGQIDEMRVWNNALSIEQIQAAMNDTLGVEYYSGIDCRLIAYWRFDELEDPGVGNSELDDVRDFSVSGVHADLEGNAFLTSSGSVGTYEITRHAADLTG